MVALRVISCIRNNTAKLDSPGHYGCEFFELIDVSLRAAPTGESQNKMAIRSADDRQLGIMAVSDCFLWMFFSDPEV